MLQRLLQLLAVLTVAAVVLCPARACLASLAGTGAQPVEEEERAHETVEIAGVNASARGSDGPRPPRSSTPVVGRLTAPPLLKATRLASRIAARRPCLVLIPRRPRPPDLRA